jgi:hypothetical protein
MIKNLYKSMSAQPSHKTGICSSFIQLKLTALRKINIQTNIDRGLYKRNSNLIELFAVSGKIMHWKHTKKKKKKRKEKEKQTSATLLVLILKLVQ